MSWPWPGHSIEDNLRGTKKGRVGLKSVTPRRCLRLVLFPWHQTLYIHAVVVAIFLRSSPSAAIFNYLSICLGNTQNHQATPLPKLIRLLCLLSSQLAAAIYNTLIVDLSLGTQKESQGIEKLCKRCGAPVPTVPSITVQQPCHGDCLYESIFRLWNSGGGGAECHV